MPAHGEYKDHVEHPRYGRRPNRTGLNEPESCWRYMDEHAIANTGVRADLQRQNSCLSRINIYYDLDKKCIDCKQSFIFFALEQKHWYEELRFPIDADCVRCSSCRKLDRENKRHKARYDELVVQNPKDRSWEENLELAELAIQLADDKVLAFRSFNHVRECLNLIPNAQRHRIRYTAALEAVSRLEDEAQA